MSDPLIISEAIGTTSDRNQEIDELTSSPAAIADDEVAGVSGRKEESLEADVAATVAVAAAPKSGEKKVGTLLAAAMKKYAVPRSSCYHGVTK